MSAWYVLAMIGATVVMWWAHEREASMPQCDTCGPMYFNEHHPDCPERAAGPKEEP